MWRRYTPPWYCRLRNAFHVSPRNDWPDALEDRHWPMGTRAERHESFLVASRRLAKLAGEPQMRTWCRLKTNWKCSRWDSPAHR
jgi:hypothetical protein